jgi:3'-phosphoadenosine 5'-phosphosulfate sulfotransferase (PAPS reductase)/FAD synthetase
MVEQGIEFEAVFSDTGCEWPETYHYLAMFQWWTKANGLRSVTILRKPEYAQGYKTLTDYCIGKRMAPSMMARWCTGDWKKKPLNKYFKKPCFVNIGIAADESKRARLSSNNGIENRFPLIEHEIDRAGCIEIIRKTGLPIPRKSGCYICPFQRAGQWKELRRYYPELFCIAKKIEELNIKSRIDKNKKPLWLSQSKKPLSEIVNERQGVLFEQDEYPPCLCGL